MSKICFVSYEIHPVTRGGCGTWLHNTVHLLLRQGHQIIFIFDMPADLFNQFDSGVYPNSCNCQAYRVEEFCTDIPLRSEDFSSKHSWRAYRFHWAAQKVVALDQPDVIEFFDFTGVGHYAFSAKLTQLAYQDTQLAVRLHNSYQLISLHQPSRPLKSDDYLLYALEHSALRLAETVLFPSQVYLNEAYRPHYEPWLGRLVHSKPALLDHPRLGNNSQEKNKILFYGRLFGFKGVDIFVDAAVKLLSEDDCDDLCFVLAGYDPKGGPDGSKTYQDYLLKRIPRRYRAQFEFVGQLSWSRLEDLLPQVCCAVFPGYFESFCYAAHELYATGLPIIVTDIPGFRDYFKHRENALLFDGTVADLARQIKALWHDQNLRERITYPYSLSDDPLGDFYEGPFNPTWIRPGNGNHHQPSILICILNDGQQAVSRTIASLKLNDLPNAQVVVLTALSEQTETEAGALWFLGKLYSAAGTDGRQIGATSFKTAQTLLILRAGDVVLDNYIAICLDTLVRQPEISFVGCWKQIHKDGQVYLDTFPSDAALELIPFSHKPLLSRVVMRTDPGKLLIDLFDARLMQLGEVSYLWDLEADLGPGVLIPECLLEQNENNAPGWSPALLSYLIAKDTSPYRKVRLANYLMTFVSAQARSANSASAQVANMVTAMRSSKMGQLVGQNRLLLKGVKNILRGFS